MIVDQGLPWSWHWTCIKRRTNCRFQGDLWRTIHGPPPVGMSRERVTPSPPNESYGQQCGLREQPWILSKGSDPKLLPSHGPETVVSPLQTYAHSSLINGHSFGVLHLWISHQTDKTCLSKWMVNNEGSKAHICVLEAQLQKQPKTCRILRSHAWLIFLLGIREKIAVFGILHACQPNWMIGLKWMSRKQYINIWDVLWHCLWYVKPGWTSLTSK